MGYVLYGAREQLLQAAHYVVGDRINERAEDPGWDAEYHEDMLYEAAQKFVAAKDAEGHGS